MDEDYIKAEILPILQNLMKEYIPELKLSLLKKLHLLVKKIGYEESEPIFLSIYQKLIGDKDWHVWETSLISF